MAQPPHDRSAWALATICLAMFAVAANTTGINTTLPAMGTDTGASVSTLQWVVNAYCLMSALSWSSPGSWATGSGGARRSCSEASAGSPSRRS
jgi:MFS family permease